MYVYCVYEIRHNPCYWPILDLYSYFLVLENLSIQGQGSIKMFKNGDSPPEMSVSQTLT